MKLQHTFPAKGANIAVELTTTDLPEATLAYLLNYGFKQCLADSYAGAENQTEATALLAKKLDALKAGTVTERAAASRDPFTAMCKTVADEMVTRALKKAGKKVEKDQKAKLVADCLEKHKDAIEAEAKKRLAAVSTIEVELDIA